MQREGGFVTTRRVRTVYFYEVVRAKDDYNPRMDDVPWQRALEEMSAKPYEERRFVTPDGDRYIGEAVFSRTRCIYSWGGSGPVRCKP